MFLTVFSLCEANAGKFLILPFSYRQFIRSEDIPHLSNLANMSTIPSEIEMPPMSWLRKRTKFKVVPCANEESLDTQYQCLTLMQSFVTLLGEKLGTKSSWKRRHIGGR